MIVIFKDVLDYPCGYSAGLKKKKMIFNALVESGISVKILNLFTLCSHNSDRVEDAVEVHNIFKKNVVVKSKLSKIFYRISAIGKEFIYLKNEKNKHTSVFLVVGTIPFTEILVYSMICSFLNIKLLIQVEEFNSFLYKKYHSNRQIKMLGYYLFDSFSPWLCHGMIVISEFLHNHYLGRNSRVKILKLPVLEDYSILPKDYSLSSNYLFFSASAAHDNLFRFVIDVFLRLESTGLQLFLVTQGSERHLKKIRTIQDRFQENTNISWFSNIPEMELRDLLSDAKLVLAPLKDDIQDKARFPQKIAEYCLAGRPIISSPVGEISFYFEEGKNIILASAGDPCDYALQISKYIEMPERMKELASESYLVGKKYFDYRQHKSSLVNFLSSVNM